MNILAISVHPDDETLGSGGTLLKHRAAGDQLFWLITTQAQQPQWSAEIIERKAVEVPRAAEADKMSAHSSWNTHRSTGIASHAELMDPIREVIAKVRPEIVYLVHDGDVHTDHHAVFQATLCVLKAFCMRKLGVRAVLSSETLLIRRGRSAFSLHAVSCNRDREIGDHIDTKIEIMRLRD